MHGDFDTDGYAIVPGVLPAKTCTALTDRLHAQGAGTRELLAQPWCAALADTLRTHPALAPWLPGTHAAIQCTGFDKSAGQNWLVPIHQDLSIPVAERVGDSALQGWSEKEGRLYVQPPRQVLEALIAVRLHLDDCGATAGPLRVVPGSHRQGRLTQAQMLAERERRGEVACLSDRGGVLLMRPLLLHASSRSAGALSRRVLHFVFGPRTLPLGLRWAQAV
ncbi:phytanoyl-CoA dioxygenase [Ralstonia solanacearum]|uniref:phytanoyl-CoA dioxygenase family protein n=2 Tax=Ralstonia pseudosolanacearum TaxID=1310165 RepID=UPI00031DAD5C|nr:MULTISPECIES: phytanoyl-CoA dioxygenase family protein [Ralstonia]AKZ26829.1 phytanoyl-CoA dioxygenase [Ralstonia solanacearum]APF87696.1 phytanoyl-CoA dioxygenase [Ralstonia solanacearum FJAT-1458]ARS55586.1 phytanoyl-CoA dioxygenase [Ralstonia solanacearum FJAT-91]ESS48684.1 hypothetical protein L665_02130 [Ralstonia solanacearum SD54]AOE89062.1 hypothetical protein LBM341_00752 [Ralstonia solanacearum]